MAGPLRLVVDPACSIQAEFNSKHDWLSRCARAHAEPVAELLFSTAVRKYL